MHYLGDCREHDYLLQDSDRRQKKLLKISGKLQMYEQEIQILIDIFNSKYEKCYTERKDRFEVSLFFISSKSFERRMSS